MLKIKRVTQALHDRWTKMKQAVCGYLEWSSAARTTTLYRVLGIVHLALVTDAGVLIMVFAPFLFGRQFIPEHISLFFLAVYITCDFVVRLSFFRGATISLGFPLIFLTLLADSPFSALLNATLGSLVSELLWSRFLSRRRPGWFMTLRRTFFYAGHHAVAGLGALIVYQLLCCHLEPWPAELGKIIHIPAALAYFVVYSLVSMLLIWPHDRRVHLFLAPDEEPFVRIDFLTTLMFLPLPASVFCLYNMVEGQTGKILIVVGILPPLFVLLFYLARKFAQTEEQRERLALGKEIRRHLGSPANMGEMVERMLMKIEGLVGYRWGAVYSLYERELRLCGEKPHKGPVVVQDPSKIKEIRTLCGDVKPGQDQVIWPPQVGFNGGVLDRLAGTGEYPQPQFFDDGLAPANPADPYLPPKTALIVLPITSGSEGLIGLVTMARPKRLFTTWEWDRCQVLSDEAGGVLLHVQRLEKTIRDLYQKVEDYAKDPEVVRQAIEELASQHVEVSKVLALVSEHSFHGNLRAVLQGVVEGRRGGEIALPLETLTEIYDQVRDETPGMPPLNPHILQLLQTITSSLSLAFSFQYQFPVVDRAPFRELYGFWLIALDANTVPDIMKLRLKIVSTVETVRADEAKRQQEVRGARRAEQSAALPPEAIEEVGRLQDIIRPLEQWGETKDFEDQRILLGLALDQLKERKQAVRERLRDPERFVFLRILDGWQAAVADALEDLERGPARLKMRLRSNQALPLEKITVELMLRNDGPGLASGVLVQLKPSPDYEVLEGKRNLGALESGKTEEPAFTLRAKGGGPLRLEFLVSYHDPERKGKAEEFADQLYLLEPPPRFAEIVNPYTPGPPIKPGNPTFVGREDIFDFIRQNMPALTQKMILVLIGERRTGKTSILQQLPVRLHEPRYVPIFIDGQVLGIDPGMESFFLSLVTAIADGLQKAGISIKSPTLAELQESPQHVFEQRFLPKVRERLGERILLLTIDEFEELGARVGGAHLPREIFPYLRHLIQHGEQLAFIFAGTHRLEESVGEYWSVLFNIAKYKKVGFLKREEAIRLIKEPVQPYGMVYDDLAIDEILRLTTGHPYFTQLLCNILVNRCNEAQRSYVTTQDVRDAIAEELWEAGRAHLTFLWQELDQETRLVLAALAESRARWDQVSGAAIVERLGNYQIRQSPGQVIKAMERLVARDIARRIPGDPVSYDLAAQLYTHWLRRYKSLGEVVQEVSVETATFVEEVRSEPATEQGSVGS